MIAVTGVPWNLRENLRKAQVQMIREVGKSSNGDDPLIRHQKPEKRVSKPVSPLSGKVQAIHRAPKSEHS